MARSIALTLLLALLAACTTRPPLDRDGPPTSLPANLDRIPDAEPRVEPLRIGGPNKPYEVLGRRYVPHTGDVELAETGLASWYGRKFHGRPTALGETYDMFAMTAAHKTMPLPSYARVRNPANGREVVVRVNDRGPFADGRVIDLSYAAAHRLGVLGGVAPVQLRRITHAEIRAGLARTEGSGAVATVAAVADVPRARDPSSLPATLSEAVVTPVAAGGAGDLDDPVPGDAPPRSGHWLQLGAFRQRDAALALQQLALREPDGAAQGVRLLEGDGWLRVQAGPFVSRAAALEAAARLQRALGVAPLLLDRR